MATSWATGTDGSLLDLESWRHDYTYDVSGNMLTDTVTRPDQKQWVKTYTYDGSSHLTSESRWVAQ